MSKFIPEVRVQISIHALREEGDRRALVVPSPAVKISIHALREEGDVPPCSRMLMAL